jgi:hypothetical protein
MSAWSERAMVTENFVLLDQISVHFASVEGRKAH